jgi:energy-coupling factor transporter ATP-binding protein EcfA2
VAVSAVQRKKYFESRAAGFSIHDSALKAKFSDATAFRMEKAAKTLAPGDDADTSARNYRELKKENSLSGPKSHEDLCPEAKRALEDFSYFRLRYFGRVDTPWQEQGGVELVKLLESEEKEYVVMNMPPGSGKTTLLHDLTCWIICRNRGIRLLTGSATMALASRNLMRVRRSLERVITETADDALKQRGLAFDAESTLALDYGRFRPLDKELWTKEAFIVMQPDDSGSISEKEPTLSAYGMDSGFIGGRFDGCFWDDLVDPRKVRSAEMREAMEDWWQDVAETRLEPAGMLALIGQRLAPDDLYRFSLDMMQPLEDEDAFDDLTEEERDQFRHDKKYKHLCYKAHYEELCSEGSHARAAAPYLEGGCLLDPRRISWRDISNLMSNRGERFAVVYQQQDLALDEVLVQKAWVYGTGGHPTSCVDNDRDRWQIPKNAHGELLNARDCIMVATADPSPTQYWSVQCWLYHPESGTRYLIDLFRGKMEAPQFLEWNYQANAFVGLMEEWQSLSIALGFPIQVWVVEQNAAQKFMLQYEHFKRWREYRNVEVIPHNTNLNKTNEDYGVTSIKQYWESGSVRLMGKGEGKVRSMALIKEVTEYPHGRTDDCVMAEWFFEWNLPSIYLPQNKSVAAWRPKWVKSTKYNYMR